MENLVLTSVPVRVRARVSPAYADSLEALARQQVDFAGLLRKGIIGGGEQAIAGEMEAAGEAYGALQARIQLESGKVVLRAGDVAAQVGKRLQTFVLWLDDGRVTAIRGGGEEG